MTDHSETVIGPMRNPSHPGDLVRHDCLEPLGRHYVTKGAEVLRCIA